MSLLRQFLTKVGLRLRSGRLMTRSEMALNTAILDLQDLNKSLPTAATLNRPMALDEDPIRPFLPPRETDRAGLLRLADRAAAYPEVSADGLHHEFLEGTVTVIGRGEIPLDILVPTRDGPQFLRSNRRDLFREIDIYFKSTSSSVCGSVVGGLVGHGIVEGPRIDFGERRYGALEKLNLYFRSYEYIGISFTVLEVRPRGGVLHGADVVVLQSLLDHVGYGDVVSLAVREHTLVGAVDSQRVVESEWDSRRPNSEVTEGGPIHVIWDRRLLNQGGGQSLSIREWVGDSGRAADLTVRAAGFYHPAVPVTHVSTSFWASDRPAVRAVAQAAGLESWEEDANTHGLCDLRRIVSLADHALWFGFPTHVLGLPDGTRLGIRIDTGETLASPDGPFEIHADVVGSGTAAEAALDALLM